MDDAVVAIQDKNTSAGGALSLIQRFNQLSNLRKLLLIFGTAAVIAVVVLAILWSRAPGFRVLYANTSDKDGGQIIQALEQMNIPYKLDAGGLISVPSDRLYEIRLRLASQGLPKGASTGFELLDNQKFGISQFSEQVNYQRAIEGELTRSIESLSAVKTARIHLAVPKQTVFLREQQKPTVSVLLTLHPGRLLEPSQIAGIIHLVSSSIPNLPVKNVTVVDQDGNLLSLLPELNGGTALNQRQLKYVHQIESMLSERIQKILEPIVGVDNVKAEVTAQVSFAEVEETSESFKPNSSPNQAAIRSEQSAEGPAKPTAAAAVGVPGALSNQPPGAAVAPITLPNFPGASGTTSSAQQKELTRNYEVDKTIKHLKQPLGSIQRLSVAVVVNYKRVNQSDGGIKSEALSADELKQVENLVREAMGYNSERGDSIKVVNAAFADRVLDVAGKSIFQKLSEYLIAHTTDIIKAGIIIVVMAYLLIGVLRPILRDVVRPKLEQARGGEEGGVALTAEELAQSEAEAEVAAEAEANALLAMFGDKIQRAKHLAKSDPRMVAMVIREWLSYDPDKPTT